MFLVDASSVRFGSPPLHLRHFYVFFVATRYIFFRTPASICPTLFIDVIFGFLSFCGCCCCCCCCCCIFEEAFLGVAAAIVLMQNFLLPVIALAVDFAVASVTIASARCLLLLLVVLLMLLLLLLLLFLSFLYHLCSNTPIYFLDLSQSYPSPRRSPCFLGIFGGTTVCSRGNIGQGNLVRCSLTFALGSSSFHLFSNTLSIYILARS